MVAVAAVCAATLVTAAPSPTNLLAVMLPANVLLEAASVGTCVVSRFIVTVPLVAPPLRPVPAVTPVIVPLPGKACPLAKLIRPLLAIERPVSAGSVALSCRVLAAPNNRFSFPEGEGVLLPTASACQRKSWSTAVLVPLLNEEACVSRGLELNPAVAVAVPVAGNVAPAADTVLLKVAVVPVRPPVRLAELPETEPVALMLPVTLWLPLKPLP